MAGELEQSGHEVRYPDLPAASDPQPEAWRDATLAHLEEGADQVVLCHSLACLVWLDLAARSKRRLAARVLLVAPPLRDDIAQVARFHDHGADSDSVATAATETLIVCSDDDPYCPVGALSAYAEPLSIEAKLIQGAGHINTDSGHGRWPWVLEWATS